MPIARMMLAGCLRAFAGLAVAGAVLMAILVVVQQMRGDEAAAPLRNGLIALAGLAAAGLSLLVARIVERTD